MYGYGNMEVRNNGSDAMTALPPTKLESAAWKIQIFFCVYEKLKPSDT
jgi:hypothetical protein